MSYFWNAVSSQDASFNFLLFLAASALKATVLLAFVALLCWALRRSSAATRHLLWTLSLCAALLLPCLSVIAVWDVPVLPAQVSSLSPPPANELARTTDGAFQIPEEGTPQRVKGRSKVSASELNASDFQFGKISVEKPLAVTNLSDVDALSNQVSATRSAKLVNWALAIWFAGALLLLFRLLVGFTATNLLTRGAVEFEDPKMRELFSSLLTELRLKGKVRLLRSERTLMPIVCGVLRPVVLLPASSDEWSEERRRMVLLHELTHITRKDCLTQLLAQAACAFYWFNPFVWHAARRLRVEREQACDDYVLSIGTKPSDYAHHLLDIARYLQERAVFQWSQTATVAMARRSQLEGRLLAILSKEVRRRAMSQATTVGVIALIFVLFLSLAIVRPTTSGAQNSRTSETAFDEKAKTEEKSLAGLFSSTISRLKDDAIAHGIKPQELVAEEGSGADAKDNPAEELLKDAQVAQNGLPPSMAEAARDIESEASEVTPPPLENIPQPPGAFAITPTINPSVIVKFQHERKPETQDKGVDFIDEMASVGYTNLTIKELVNLKASGVTADYVRSLRALGLGNLTTKELSGLRVNDVTPAFIQAIRNAGYKELTTKELTSFSAHGVTPEFINKLRNVGYGDLFAKQLIDFAAHEVTPEFINSMRAIGFGTLSPKDLVSLRAHEITPAFVRDARKRLGDLTVKQIIALKINGLIEGSDNE